MTEVNTQNKILVITADDFGLDASITKGIIDAHKNGIVTATSVLANAPYSQEAFILARDLPDLEFGLHLAIVESKALNKKAKTIIANISYFGCDPCLERNWQKFIPRYILGRIALGELEYEFELQIERFVKYFHKIPFINGTQHLHLLPQIQDIILNLAQKYRISGIRSPLNYIATDKRRKRIPTFVMKYFGRKLSLSAEKLGISSIENMAGFDVSGCLNEEKLILILNSLPNGICELCCHPGYTSEYLQQQLPQNYNQFEWEEELKALTSVRIKNIIRDNSIVLTNFTQLMTLKNGK